MRFNKKLVYSILFLVLIVFVIFQIVQISKFKSLPSPLLGGDYYYQLGVVNHLKYGGSFFQSSSEKGGVPGYLYLYAVPIALFSSITHVSSMESMFIFSVIYFIIAYLLWFFLINMLFKNPYVALIGSLLLNPLSKYPLLKYTPFTQLVMIPLFLYVLYIFFEVKKVKGNLLKIVSLSVVFGLLSISHALAFSNSIIILLVFFIYEHYAHPKNKKQIDLKWLVFIMIAIPITLLYFYRPIFVFHFSRPYDRVHLDTPDYAYPNVQSAFIKQVLHDIFNFSGLFQSTITIFFLASGYFIFKKRKKKEAKFIALFFIASLTDVLSVFVTQLFGFNLGPPWVITFFFNPSRIILALYALMFSVDYTAKWMAKKKVLAKRFAEEILLILIICVLTFYSVSATLSFQKKNRFFSAVYSPVPSQFQSMADFVIKNTNVNDVFMSSKELSFILNSLTGRKVLTNRWAHQNDPWSNVPRRDLIETLILYGDNLSLIKKLIKEYDVKYLYWDIDWPLTEFSFNSNGQVIGLYDPLIVLNKGDNEKVLINNGILYQHLFTQVDPAEYGNDKIKKFDSFIILDKNYRSFEKPWRANLDPYLKMVWNYTQNGSMVSAIYKINLN